MLGAGTVFHVKHDALQSLPTVNVSRETSDRLMTFCDLLHRWSRTVNLVARGDLPFLWKRHIEDSLQLLPLVPPDGELIDLGSGAGFPALILAIASGRMFHLVEADQRKAAFLREAARATGALVTIHATRIELAVLPPAQLVTARALGAVPQLLAWATPLLTNDGECLFPRGRRLEGELTQARVGWHMRVRRWQSNTDPDAVILQIGGLSRDVHGQL